MKCQIPSIFLPHSQTISHKPEPVWTPILDIKILCAETVENLLVVEYTAGIHASDFAVCLAVLVPRTTAARPCGALHEFLGIHVVIICGVWADLDGSMHNQLKCV